MKKVKNKVSNRLFSRLFCFLLLSTFVANIAIAANNIEDVKWRLKDVEGKIWFIKFSKENIDNSEEWSSPIESDQKHKLRDAWAKLEEYETKKYPSKFISRIEVIPLDNEIKKTIKKWAYIFHFYYTPTNNDDKKLPHWAGVYWKKKEGQENKFEATVISADRE